MTPEQGESRPAGNETAIQEQPDTQEFTPLDGALWAASHGAPVFPLGWNKRPLIKGGKDFDNASTEVAQIDAWQQQFNPSAWAMVNGHTFDVIDLDGDTARDNTLEHFTGVMPLALGWVQTPHGWHGYIHATGRRRSPGKVLGGKVDLLGAGGYVVLPGSWVTDKYTDQPVTYGWITAPADPAVQFDMAPWLALWDLAEQAKPKAAPSAQGSVGQPTDPERAKGYATATLEGLHKDLAAAADWDDAMRDDHGRGWEKLVSDAAYTVGRLARTPGTGVTMDTGLDVLLELVPAVMGLEVNASEKWRQQATRGEAFALPAVDFQGLNLPTVPGPAAPAVDNSAQETGAVDRRVVGALHGQTQFAYGLGASSGNRHLYAHGIGWHHFEGKRWREDVTGKVYQELRRLLERTAAANIENSAVLQQVRAATSASAQDGILKIARTMPEFAREPADLDADPHLLNVGNGTLNLETLELRAHDPADGITKVCRASWQEGLDWRASRWGTFLAEVLPDEGVRGYLQRYVGLALLGEVLEHKLVVLTGTGRNGKGVLYASINHMLGDYAIVAEPELFLHREGAHPTGQMDLRGARWVVVSETENGRRLADATVKRLTGGDTIKARRMGKDFTQFEPSHTAALITNHLPKVSADDPAMWSRLRVVPFGQKFEGTADQTGLKNVLKAEADAVLAWAVEGLRDYRARGLAEPAAVLLATAAYKEDNDSLSEFLGEALEEGYGPSTTVKSVHERYGTWCGARKVETESLKNFAAAMEAKGFHRRKVEVGFVWRGPWEDFRVLQNPLSEPDAAKAAVPAVSKGPTTKTNFTERGLETAETAGFQSGGNGYPGWVPPGMPRNVVTK